MSSFSFFTFIALMAVFSLLLLLTVSVLSYFKVTSLQRLAVLKVGLFILGTAPFVFLTFRAISLKTIEVALPPPFLDPQKSFSGLGEALEMQTHWSGFALWVYGFICTILLLRIGIAYVNTRRKLSFSREVFLHGSSVFLCSEIRSPLSFGFPKTSIYFPEGVEQRWTAREIEMSLTHEKIHIRRNDNMWKIFSLIVRTLFFFAPWSYSLHRRVELEMEISCDEQTCLEARADVQEYGNLLLAMVCPEQFKYSLVTNITNSSLKRRILAMKSRTIQRPLLVAVASFILFLTGSLTIAATSGMNQKKDVFKVSAQIFLNGKLLSKPRLIVAENEEALIKQRDGESSLLELRIVPLNVAIPNLPEGIGLNMEVSYKIGETVGHHKPQVILSPGEEGIIEVSKDGQVYKMLILAERQ